MNKQNDICLEYVAENSEQNILVSPKPMGSLYACQEKYTVF